MKLYDENDDKQDPRQLNYLFNLINFEAVNKIQDFKDEYLPNDGYDIKFIKDFYKNPTKTDLRDYL